MKIGFLCVYLGFLIAVLVGLLVRPPTEPPYKYRDTIEFHDRETGDARKTIRNAEFRLLNKDDIMYGVKMRVGEKEQEALVMDRIPPDCFVSIRKDPE